ncbi:MAG: uroporphyrinogen decarboxylase [Chloroflexi bacterium]|nr:MAG: uroporphyrinogen decarboxylase [Chloroflexota bacterium]
MSEQLTARERVQAALHGEALDHPPVSLWRHFPERDQSAADLALATLEWQQQFQLDFIKLMPPGDYATIDWGAVSEFQGAPGGTRTTTHYPVSAPEDWSAIKPVPATAGFNAHVVETCRLVRQALGPDIPILQTVFSPLTIAHKLSAGRVLDHLRSDPDAVLSALEVIRDVTVELTKASLAAGASGVFFASQCATSDMLTPEEYAIFGTPFDLPVLAAAIDNSEFTLVHIHGTNAFFDVLAEYPAHALNWHDRRVGPAIPTALSAHPAKAAVAGIDEHGIASMTPDDVRAQVLDARASAGDRRLLIGTGCVALVATPAANIRAAVAAARETR